MIVWATAPLRVSFVGGGSDLPAFNRHEVGAVVSAALDLRMSVTVMLRPPAFGTHTRLIYSRIEETDTRMEWKHDIARHCVGMFGIDCCIEVASLSQVKAGTGLASSSAYTVALLAALNKWAVPKFPNPAAIAQAACVVEIEKCGHTIGRQDQFACALGGMNFIEFFPSENGYDGPVRYKRLSLWPAGLQNNLLLLYTGRSRAATDVLGSIAALDMNDSRNRASLRAMANLAHGLKNEFENNNGSAVGAFLQASWALKKHLPGVADNEINDVHKAIVRAGGPLCGAKLLGAGQGGCFLVWAPKERHPDIIRAVPTLKQVPCELSSSGVTAVRV